MNGVMVMLKLLQAYAPLTDKVAAKSIVAGTVPLGDPLPAIGVTEIGRRELGTVANDEKFNLVSARVQVTVYAKKYPDVKAILLAAKLGPGLHAGQVAGVKVRSVRRLAVGPDLSDDAAKTYQQSRDFMVTYLEPN